MDRKRYYLNLTSPELDASHIQWSEGQNINFKDFLHADKINNQLYYDYGDKTCVVGTLAKFFIDFGGPNHTNCSYYKMGFTLQYAKTELLIDGPNHKQYDVKRTETLSEPLFFEFDIPSMAYDALITIKPKYTNSLGVGTQIFIKDIFIERDSYFNNLNMRENILVVPYRKLSMRERAINKSHKTLTMLERASTEAGSSTLAVKEKIGYGGVSYIDLLETIKPNAADPAGYKLLTLTETVPYTLFLNEKIYGTNINKHYLNCLNPDTDESRLTWDATEEVVAYTNKLRVQPKLAVNGTGKITITYPYSPYNAGIGFKIAASRGSYNRLVVYLNGESKFISWGAAIDKEFYYEIPSSHFGDTILEFEYDYITYQTDIEILNLYSVEHLGTLNVYEVVESMSKSLSIKEMIIVYESFKLREKIGAEGAIFSHAWLATQEKIRNFGLDGLGIYLDEYVLSRTGYSKLGLREKTYDTCYKGRTGKVLVEIIKAPQ